MSMSKSGDGEGDNMSGSTESSESSTMKDTTPVPGMKKSKREAEALSSSTSLETSYASGGTRDDNRDSTEVTWTKSTTNKTKGRNAITCVVPFVPV